MLATGVITSLVATTQHCTFTCPLSYTAHCKVTTLIQSQTALRKLSLAQPARHKNTKKTEWEAGADRNEELTQFWYTTH